MNVPVKRDEFETVKQLLASAATYSESASRKADRLADSITRLEASQNRTDEMLQELSASQKKTEECLQRFTQQTEKNLAQLTQRIDALSQRVDSFAFEAQRLHTGHAQKINRLDAMISRYDGILAYLMRKEHPEME